jgi:hypothetical protein
VVLAVVTNGLGASIAWGTREKFMKAFVGTLAISLLVFLLCWADKIRFRKQAAVRAADDEKEVVPPEKEEVTPADEDKAMDDPESVHV